MACKLHLNKAVKTDKQINKGTKTMPFFLLRGFIYGSQGGGTEFWSRGPAPRSSHGVLQAPLYAHEPQTNAPLSPSVTVCTPPLL